MNRKNFLSMCLAIILVLGLFPTYSNASEVLYQGYHEKITVDGDCERTGLRIKDGKEPNGGDSIAYCYDISLKYPAKEYEPDYNEQDDKCYFSKIENYLESDDEYIMQYGEETKQKVAMALYAGYPCDAFGYRKLYPSMSDDEARMVTQNMVWDITIKNVNEYPVNRPPSGWSGYMVQYYNTIYKNVLMDFKEGTEFHQGWLDIVGDFEFKNFNGYYQTGEIKTSGEKGCITFSNVDSGMEILNWNTNKPVTDTGLNVGESFYVRSTTPLEKEQKFELNYSYDQVNFYFYKYQKGGQRIKDLSSGKSIQNLIRVEPTKHKIMEKFEVTLDGKKVPVQEKTSVTVKKEWIGPADDSVTIHLEADGMQEQTIMLNEENGWSYTFENLNKYNTDGREIQYTVKEEPMANYQSEIIGNMVDGFIVKNTNMGMRQISVQKKWEGGMEDKVIAKLISDNQEIASTILNEENGWKYIFDDVPKYDPVTGLEIQYRVEEDPIPDGYKSKVIGDATNGFVLINSKIIVENSGSIDITEDTMSEQSGSLPEYIENSGSIDITEDTMSEQSGSLLEYIENSGSIDITEDTMSEQSGSLPKYVVTEEEEEHSGNIEFTEDTMPGESGSLLDYIVTEEEEEHSSNTEFTEDTMPGESGPLPNYTVTEEDTTSNKPTIPNRDTTPDESSTPDRPTTPDESSTPDRPTTPDESSTPDRPTTPDESSTPDRPITPDELTTLGRPTTPDELTTFGSPTTPDESSTPDSPTTPDELTTPDQLTTLGRPTTPDQPITTNRSDDTPKTEDNSHIELWASLSIISLYSAIVLLLWNLKKRRMQ